MNDILEKLKPLSSPILEAELFTTVANLKKAFPVSNELGHSKLDHNYSVKFSITISSPNNLVTGKFFFPTDKAVPEELHDFFERWVNRLLADKWLLENAIEDISQSEGAD